MNFYGIPADGGSEACDKSPINQITQNSDEHYSIFYGRQKSVRTLHMSQVILKGEDKRQDRKKKAVQRRE